VAAEHPDVVARVEAYLRTARTEPRRYAPQPQKTRAVYVYGFPRVAGYRGISWSVYAPAG
jgi:hypothetical protein